MTRPAAESGPISAGPIEIELERLSDRPEIERFLIGLSAGSRQLRYWSATNDGALLREAEREDEALRHGAFGFVARNAAGELVGHAIAIPDGPGVAEVAFEVADAYQSHGIGTALFARIIAEARERGYKALTAEVLNVNRRMIDVFAHSGLPSTSEWSLGATHLTMPLE